MSLIETIVDEFTDLADRVWFAIKLSVAVSIGAGVVVAFAAAVLRLVDRILQ